MPSGPLREVGVGGSYRRLLHSSEIRYKIGLERINHPTAGVIRSDLRDQFMVQSLS